MRALEAQNCVVGETGSENCRLTQETDAKLFIFVIGAVYTAKSDAEAVYKQALGYRVCLASGSSLFMCRGC